MNEMNEAKDILNDGPVMTTKLKERFCKDIGLPIKVFEEPVFSERLQLYDKHFHCISKYEDFKVLVTRFNGEEGLFEAYNKLKDTVINELKDASDIKKFNEEDMNKFAVTQYNFPSHDIYKCNNDGRKFVSLDMKRGNFTALHYYSPDIFGNSNTYEDYIRKFTDAEHFKSSKYIRQVIFGNINPKRQCTFEKYLMGKVMEDVLKEFQPENIAYYATDEIVLDITNDERQNLNDTIQKIVEKNVESGINIRGEAFSLHKIQGIDGFVKSIYFPEEKTEIKCVDSLYMPFLLRKMYNEEITENDKEFTFNGIRAKLIDIPEIRMPWIEEKNAEKVQEEEI